MIYKYNYFLILHYGSEIVTIECVESILKFNRNDVKIVIVDNASENGSYEKLHEKYSNIEDITILQVKEPKGFSYGNNFGYQYIRKQGNAAFIIVCNNDIVFMQNNFIDILNTSFNNDNFYVAGPDIYNTALNRHQNPFKYEIANVKQVDESIRSVEYELKHIKSAMVRDYFVDYLKKSKVLAKINQRKYRYEQSRLENVCIHGSCVIVSSLFVEKAELLFEPMTTFYCEEEILSYRCSVNKWKISYLPELKVEHRESKATKQKYAKYLERRKFMLTNTLESLNILKDFIIEINR